MQGNKEIIDEEYEHTHNFETVSPSTQKYVSQLTQLPSPRKTKKNIKYEKLLDIVMKQKKLLAQKRLKISRLIKQKAYSKKNKKNVDPSTLFNNSVFSSKNSKALVTMQLLHTKKKPWTQAEKNVATSIYFKSPSTYRFMRRNKIVLPGVTTIQRWLKSLMYLPGFVTEYNSQLTLMTKVMTEQEKKCVVLIDEMSIKMCLEYNKSLDFIETMKI